MKRRDLSADERALWGRAVRDVRPRARTSAAITIAKKAAPAPKGKSPTTAPALRAAKANAHRILGGGDPGVDRRAATGRIAIERTLDLHGLTQAVAHRRLSRFIEAAADDSVRLALIITGKGRSVSPAAGASRGILKTRFFDWIEEAPMRSHIARVSPARPRDGGAGAFYVFLKGKGRRE